jgi:hypothetical protein
MCMYQQAAGEGVWRVGLVSLRTQKSLNHKIGDIFSPYIPLFSSLLIYFLWGVSCTCICRSNECAGRGEELYHMMVGLCYLRHAGSEYHCITIVHDLWLLLLLILYYCILANHLIINCNVVWTMSFNSLMQMFSDVFLLYKENKRYHLLTKISLRIWNIFVSRLVKTYRHYSEKFLQYAQFRQ